MNTKQIFEALPASWDNVSLKTFQSIYAISGSSITDLNEYQQLEFSIAILSVMTGISADKLENLPVKDIQTLYSKLSFMNVPPVKKKSSVIKWKELQEVTYDDYIGLINLNQDPEYLSKLDVFVKLMNKNSLTSEQIQALPITEVFYGFFLLRKRINKYLKSSIRYQVKKILKLKLKQKFKALVTKLSMKGKK